MSLKYTAPYILEKKSEEAAGFDITADEDILILPLQSAIISTGLYVEIPKGYFGLITMRSGHGFKHGLMSHIGIIDSDYRGEVKVRVFNSGSEGYLIQKGERFAQLTLIPNEISTAVHATFLSETVRGLNGFGSTGVQC